MKLSIPKDYFTQDPVPPRLFLCTPSGKIINELPAISVNIQAKWNSYSELSFEVQMHYVDILTGETKVHPLYSTIESPRQIYAQGMGFFILQDINDIIGDNDIKSVTAFSAEYAVAGKYLNSFYINTGEIGSVEVTYNEQQNGLDYSTDRDSFYKLASGAFDPYESYYVKVPTEDSYTWEQEQISDANEYAKYINNTSESEYDKLYMKNFPNVQFYNNNRTGLSLLHLVLNNIPDWEIGSVDQSLWRKERTFSQDRISVYDFLMQDVAETFGCVFEWDTLTHKLNVYEEAEDGITDDNAIQTRWNTDVYISKDNLASEVNVSYSSDEIKTKLIVTGSDDLDIREVNLGRNEIVDLSFYHTLDWMEQDLYDAYDNYLEIIQEAESGLTKDGLPSKAYPVPYSEAMQGWVAANNRYSDMMNAVPAEGNVVLIGDEFKKLYCIYEPIDTAYATITINNGTQWVDKIYKDSNFSEQIVDMKDGTAYVVQGYLLTYKLSETKFQVSDEQRNVSKISLIDKLNLYHVDEDIKANKNDNILLRLKNSASDVATVRIYDKRKVATEYEGTHMNYYIWDPKSEKYGEVSFKIKNGTEFSTYKSMHGANLHTNDFYVQSIVVKATSGISEAADEYSVTQWINGELTATKMDLEQYTISYIGTMGAYFVLAKDERNKATLEEYGVRLLQEKHDTYTKIFQTQTEEMFSQEKYQCIVQDTIPEGNYNDGTRWLDSNSVPTTLYSYNASNSTWEMLAGVENAVSTEDKKNYENYQRYVDNYEKLKAVQTVLTEKEREAEYYLNGFEVANRTIDVSLYKRNANGHLAYNGELLEADMHRAAEAHFTFYGDGGGITVYNVVRSDFNEIFPLYTFTTAFDPIGYGKNTEAFNPAQKYYIKTTTGAYSPVLIETKEEFATYDGTTSEKTLYVVTKGHYYAVYLNGTTPYVAYANSQGVYQMIMEYIRAETEMNKFFTTDQWIRLSPFIKEDEFNDSNFLLTGYESEEERIKICKELMDAASKELKTICQPSLSFSMTMANILALPEFEPLFGQFQLGNFIRVAIRDDYVKRARLLEVNLDFDDMSDFSCTFGNLVTTKTEVDKHADLLAQAVSAGKQVAAASGDWQRAVDKSNKLEESIASGLQDAALQIGRASGQAIEWGQNGFFCRKFKDGSTTEYEDEQIAIINNKIVFTNSNWATSKAALGEFQVDVNGDGVDETMYGLIADAVVSGYIKGSAIEGGSLKIGGKGGTFIVNPDGSVQILGPDAETPVYATKDTVDLINQATQYRTSLEYTGTTIFTEPGQTCTITCKVFDWDKDITDSLPTGTVFKWIRASNVSDTVWNTSHTYTDINTITITNEDIEKNAQFYCECTFDETKLS